jgi:hypothetical protein
MLQIKTIFFKILSFSKELAEELKRIRKDPLSQEIEQLNYMQSEWMELAEIMPEIETIDSENDPIIDKDFDWLSLKNCFTNSELDLMDGWIEKMKNETQFQELEYEKILPNQLNKEQKFAYNLIKNFNEKNEQILLIIT